MAQAIQAVERGVFDVMLLTKTKIQSETYLHNRLGYNLTCSAARPSSARGTQGRVGMVTSERPVVWRIESTLHHRPNVVRCKIVTGLTQTPPVSVYLPPSTLEHLPDLQEDLHHFGYPIFIGELNVDLEKARSLWIP